MPVVELTDSILSSAIEQALSQPPSKAGRRLRSERDLGTALHVNHSVVRRSLDRLVEKGVLVRRHGSGTYVRRVPSPSPAKGAFPGNLDVSPEVLFAHPSVDLNVRQALAPTKEQQQLQLGLWTDFTANPVPARQALLNGVVHRAQESGHRVTIHSLMGPRGQELSAPQLAQRLREVPSDGYLVAAWWGDLFLEALGARSAPTVFFQDSSGPIRLEPVVFLNSHEAVQRAVGLLAAEGHERIGLLGLDIPDEPVGPMQLVYDRAMADAGLPYRASEFSGPGVSDAMAAIRRLLRRPDPPEAVYVSDDVILTGVAEALVIDRMVPGRDLGLICYSTPNYPQPSGHQWSRLEFDVEGFGEVIVDSLLRLIQTAGTRVSSRALHAAWMPGSTHVRNTSSRSTKAGRS